MGSLLLENLIYLKIALPRKTQEYWTIAWTNADFQQPAATLPCAITLEHHCFQAMSAGVFSKK